MTTKPTPGMTSPGPTDPIEDLVAPTPRPLAVQVTGTVVDGVEKGCLMLNQEGGVGPALALVGETAGLSVGQRVTLWGTMRPDLATTCQQGQVFNVLSLATPT
ncbi:MAG: hypothetical protein KBF43_10915 [Dermatophilaceae bacterium]|jgi:hypothetical protein|nr:hypothetical protein [Actinomycetales bacterium]MBP8880808.1 hypothetical protein [Dermatophilaceae bacterium]MBP9919085.1 hypothetical protein [Dermatophilaceae bacterium]